MVLSVILLVAIFIWVALQHLYRDEQMTGKTARLLTLWRKVKKFIIEWWTGLRPLTKWTFIGIVAFIVFLIFWTSTGLFDWIDTGHHYPNQ